MPICPPKSAEKRATESSRWEHVVGKALKDWTSRVMKTTRMTRAEARQAILEKIQESNPEGEPWQP